MGVDLTIANNLARCEGETFTIIPDLNAPPGTTFEWQYEDPPGSGIFVPFVPAETGPTLDVTVTGTYKLIADFAGVCQSEGQLFIEFAPISPSINFNPDPLVVCDDDNDGFSGFDLTLADVGLTGGDPDLFVSYHATQLDAENGVLPLSSPYVNVNPYGDVVWARVASLASSCYAVVAQPLEVRDRPVAVAPPPLRLCDDAVADGFTEFDLTVVVPVVLGGMDPLEFDVWFYEDLGEAQAAGDAALVSPDFSQAISSPGSYVNLSDPQTLWVLVVGNASSTSPNNGASGCYDIVPLELWVDPNPVDLGPFEYPLCDDGLNGSTLTDQVSTFDLTVVDPQATGGDPLLFVLWYESYADEAADLPIADPTSYQNTSNSQTVVGRVENGFGCRVLVTLTLTVLPNPSPNGSPSPLEECDDDDDGIASTFVLTDRDAEIIGGEPDVSVLYYLTPAAAEAGVPGTELSSPYTNTVPGGELVWARVESDVPPGVLPCYTVVGLQLVVVPLPAAPVEGFLDPFFACDGDGDGLAGFDLEVQTPFVAGGQVPPGFTVVTYHLSQADAQSGSNPVDTSVPYVSGGGEVLWARLGSVATGCVRATPFSLEVGALPLLGTGEDLYRCDDEVGGSTPDDGFSTFDLTANAALLDPGGSLSLSYYASASDQANGIAIGDPSAYRNEVSPQQEVFVTGTAPDGCPGYSSFLIVVEPNPTAPMQAPLVSCDEDNDGFGSFDLTLFDAGLANGEPVTVVGYYLTEAAAEAAVPGTELVSPYTNIVMDAQTVWARVENDVPPGVNPCYSVVSVGLVVAPLPLAPDPALFGDLASCDVDGDGLAAFDLTANDAGALGGNGAPGFSVTYHESQADAESGVGAIDPATSYVSGGGTVWARVAEGLTGCARVTPFSLSVEAAAELGPGPFVSVLCDDEVGGSSPDDGVSTFNLTLSEGEILPGGASGYQVSYYASQAAQDAGDAIADPTSYQNTSNPDVVYVSVFGDACEVRTELSLEVVPNPTPTDPGTYAVCDGVPEGDLDPYDGLSVFDLHGELDALIVDGEPGVTVEYYASEAEADAGAAGTELPSPYASVVAWSQVVWARVTQGVPPSVLACHSVLAVSLEVSPLALVGGSPADLVECEVGSDGFSVFDLTANDSAVLDGQDPSQYQVLYFRSGPDALAGADPVGSPGAFANTSNPQQLWAGILSVAGCYAPPPVDPVTGEAVGLTFAVEVREGAQAFAPPPQVVCDNREPFSDGVADFDLSADPSSPTPLVLGVLGGQDPSVYAVGFYGTQADAEAGTGALPSVYANLSNPQVVWARVTNTSGGGDVPGCWAVVPVVLSVDFLPPFSLGGPYRLCVDAQGAPLAAESGAPSPPVLDTGLPAEGYAFSWSLGGQVLPNEVSPSVVALGGGTYSVEVTELSTGCTAVAVAEVAVSSPPLEYSAGVASGAFAGEHVVVAGVTLGLGQWEYSIDGGPFQDSGTFPGVSPGGHLVEISDALGCGSVQVPVFVVDYPRFVTPNGDGYHDTWSVAGLDGLDPSARVYVFDRYGKLLKELAPSGPGWDGTFNGAPVPSDDYWFRIEYDQDGAARQFTGHFTLKR